MFPSTRPRRSPAPSLSLEIAPLIDIVFILLVFFLVTTTFAREAAVDVERARAGGTARLAPEALRVSIAASGAIYTEGDRVELTGLAERVRRFAERAPRATVVVIPDRRLPAGRLVEVIDRARSAGAGDVTIAARERGTP